MFVDHSTRDREETVVLRYAAAFYWLMWPTLAMTVWASLHSTTATNVAAGLAWLLLLGFGIPYWPIIFKLKRRMRDGDIVASGSKYSFTNPLSYRWPSTDGSEQDG